MSSPKMDMTPFGEVENLGVYPVPPLGPAAAVELKDDTGYGDVAQRLVAEQRATDTPVVPKATPPDEPSDYSDIAREVVQAEPAFNRAAAAEDMRRRGELLRWRVLNDARPPEEQAEVLRLSTALGWAPDVVAADLPAARKAVEAKNLDVASVLAAHPALAEFLGDPEKSALARSDTARLTGLAYLVGTGTRYLAGGIPVDDGEPKVPGLIDLLFKGRSLSRDIHDDQAKLMAGGVLDGAPTQETIGSPDVPAPMSFRSLTEAEKEGLREDVRKKAVELDRLRRFGDGVEEMGTVKRLLANTARFLVDTGPEIAKGAAASAIGSLAGGVGGVAVGSAYWAAETAPSIYWQLSELKGPDGKTPLLSEDEARSYALAASLPIGVVNTVGLEGVGLAGKGWLTSRPVVERAVSRLLPNAVKRVTASPRISAILGRAVLNFGSHEVQGGLMLAMQSGLQAATVELAKAAHGQEASAGAAVNAFEDGFTQGVVDFAAISAFRPALQAFREHGRIRAATEQAKVLADIAQNTRESKLAQRSPEQFEELLGKFGPDKTVYVDREAFDSFAQEKLKGNGTPRDLAADIVGDKGEAYDRAQASGGDLAIPLSRWATKVVLPGHDAKLAQDAKTSATDMTPRQTVEAMKLIAKRLNEDAKARGPAFEQEVRGLEAQLAHAAFIAGHKGPEGKAFAKELSTYSATMALRMGVGVREALVRVGLPLLHLEGRNVLSDKLLAELQLSPEEAANAGMFSQANPRDVQVAVRSFGHVYEHPESPLRLTVYPNAEDDYGLQNTRVVRLLAFGPKTKESVQSIKEFGGQGYSTALYLRALMDAKRAREGLASDAVRTDATERMYARLKELGIPFELRRMNDLIDYYYVPAEKLSKVNLDSAWQKLQERAQTEASSFATPEEIDKLLSGLTELRQAGSPTGDVITGELAQGQATRGSIRFRVGGDGQPYDFDIRALQGDKSTLAHETAHFLGWSLHRVATEKNAPADVRADYETLLKFAGFKSAEERAAANKERSALAAKVAAGGMERLTTSQKARLRTLEAKEERVSYAWEQYLSEGKAPTQALQPVFSRFRRWMADVYRGLQGGIAEQYQRTYGEELGFSPEVRGVFDRLLAVDDTLAKLRADEPKLDFASVLRLTPEETQQLQALDDKRTEGARESLDQAAAADQGRAAGPHLYAARERMRAEVHDEVSSQPVYVARSFLGGGELYDPNTGKTIARAQLPEKLRGAKLSHEEALALVGAEKVKTLDEQGIVAKGGMKADDLAPVLGFDSGKALVDALVSAPDRDRVVEQETARRFEDAFGPELAKRADALAALGADAMRSPADLRRALVVRDALARELGRSARAGGRLPTEVLDRNAQRIVEATRIKELSPKAELDAERRAAKRAFDLMAKASRAREGEKHDEADALYAQALHEWDYVIQSKLLWRRASDMLDTLDAAEARMRRAAKVDRSAMLGKADQALAYANANDAILGALGFKDGVKPDAAVVDQALAAMKRDGGEVVETEGGKLESALWDSQAVRELVGAPAPWDHLTAAEALNAHDAVENLRAVASRKGKVTLGEKVISQKALLDALDESSAKLVSAGEARDPAALGPKGKVFNGVRRVLTSMDANLTEMETLIERLTAGNRDHPAWQLFVGERLKARDRELVLADRFVKRIEKFWKDLPPEMRKSKDSAVDGVAEALPMPRTDIINPLTPVSRGQLWMIALQLGNAGNKQRLLDGYGWTERQVMAVLQRHLTKQEWGWVQGVWDALGDLYPEIEKVHIADTGLRPEKVEAAPFTVTTADGETVELKGGYFPARYDPRIPSKRHVGEAQEDAVAAAVRAPLYQKAKTVTGHAKARAEQNEDLLSLDFAIVPAHVAQVIHDVTHRLYVKEVAGVVLGPRFQTIVRGRMGLEYEKQFRSWAQSVAAAYAANPSDAMRTPNALFSWAKSRATLAAVGFNVGVPLQDLTNPLLPLFGGDVSLSGLALATRKLAGDPMGLRGFALEMSPELRARARHGNSLGINVEQALQLRGTVGEVEKAAYWMMEFSDRATATPVWLAKFYDLKKQGVSDEVAVRDADAVVRKYFPSSDPSMRAAWLRDKGPFGALTFLYGFGNKVYNMNRRTITAALDAVRDPAEGAGDKAKAIGAAMFAIGGQAATMALLGDYISGKTPKDDQDFKGWAMERLSGLAGYQIPFAQLAIGGRGALPAPGLAHRLLSEGYKTMTLQNGPAESIAALGSLAALGTGANQALRTGKYIDEELVDDLRRGGYARAAGNLAFGQRKGMR